MENIKDLLEDLIASEADPESDADEPPDCINSNQWLLKKLYGATILGEHFYNRGSLDGNEVMRQYLLEPSGSLLGGSCMGLQYPRCQEPKGAGGEEPKQREGKPPIY